MQPHPAERGIRSVPTEQTIQPLTTALPQTPASGSEHYMGVRPAPAGKAVLSLVPQPAPRVVVHRVFAQGRRALEPRLPPPPTPDITWCASTEVGNRGRFVERLRRELVHSARRNHRLAVLFTGVHDTAQQDHAQGFIEPYVLNLLTLRLANSLRPRDTLLRVGSSHFATICPDLTDADQAMGVADRMRTTAASPIPVVGGSILLSLSLSIVFTKHQDDF
jgi:GGDEF domain-containing protein